MHWGHAISTDMVTWKEMPIAIYPDEKGYIFSGSAVVDVNNSSGFSKNGIEARTMYTCVCNDKCAHQAKLSVFPRQRN